MKDINVDEKVTSFEFNGNVLYLAAGKHKFVIRNPTFIGTYREPRKKWAILAGIILLIASVASIKYLRDLKDLSWLLIVLGLGLIVWGLITKAVVTIETETGTTITAPISSSLATKLIEESKNLKASNNSKQ